MNHLHRPHKLIKSHKVCMLPPPPVNLSFDSLLCRRGHSASKGRGNFPPFTAVIMSKGRNKDKDESSFDGAGKASPFPSLSYSQSCEATLSTRKIIDSTSEISRVCNTGLDTSVLMTFQMDRWLNYTGWCLPFFEEW